ncbi:MAG TPA: heparinase II/III family protein [Lachnospiraceae bacterium]|nr:heparinase II/III family protein [Lachnospiraceae bacterium]
MYFEIADNYTERFKQFKPYSTAANKMAWGQLDEDWKSATIKAGESYLTYIFPHISATVFMDFTRTGNRVNLENVYFEKRRTLNALVLAESLEGKGRFLDKIIDGIFAICDEPAWQLPAHNSYERDTPQLPLPDVTQPLLDLFSCETGALLATIHYLLAESLDNVSLLITKRIRYELNNRIYAPYLNRHFWWMGNGKEPMCNWTIWCTQNILLSVFLISQDEELNRKVFLKASRSVDYFLDEYGIDGCCDEGAQYYRHSGLCLFNTTEILNAITDNAFNHLYQEEKIRNIASYILNVHIDDKYYVNFADCSPVAGRMSAREFLFAKRIQNDSMMQFAASDFFLREDLLLSEEINLYYRVQSAFSIIEMRHFKGKKFVYHPDTYYESVGLFITRDNSLYLSVKAGDNDDSHNHNDTGSFTIYKQGKPMFVDVGVESYTKKTFSPKRYEIWTMQSAYHNLPTVSGMMQLPGPDYKATDVKVSMEEMSSSISMDIASAYPKEAGLQSYNRTALLDKGNCITIKDHFFFNTQSEGNVVLSLMTYEKPTIKDKVVTIGDLGCAKINGDVTCAVEEIPITDQRLKTAWEHSLYRVLVQVYSNEIELVIQ